ncbi:UvrD-helicase domain-containing protein [Roseibacillus ishigakijimensis]|nr:UvrD-helicase domain-containing protein [Roseibacillus ishigakijimensis]
MTNEIILASAGSGKTYQLTNRYLALMARELLAGREPQPEKILALTFTRKAAGEFFDEILKKLAQGATSEENARKLAGPSDPASNPLHPLLSQLTQAHYRQLLVIFVRRMPRLFLGTLDALFANIVRSFPAEFGLTGDFDILDDHQESLARSEALRRVFEQAFDEHSHSAFFEAFRLITAGQEEAAVQGLLDRYIQGKHALFLTAASPQLWGNPDRIWPRGCPWLGRPGEPAAELSALFAHFEEQGLLEKQWEWWRQFERELLAHTPGTPWEGRLNSILGKILAQWDEIQAGETAFAINRNKQTFDATACRHLENLTTHLVGAEIESCLRRTRGTWALLQEYEESYAQLIRSKGQLTFQDITVLLAGPAGSSVPLLSQQADAESRLRIDYRLDANYHHWLLDEFQDTSYLQWEVIQNLIDEVMDDPSGERSLFQVGDTKQAIYGWRGGDTRLFDDIRRRYQDRGPRALTARDLSVSWRSGHDVISPLNTIFNDRRALEKLGFPRAALDRWHWSPHQVAPPNDQLPGLTAYYSPLPTGDKPDPEDNLALMLALLEEIQPLQHGLSCVILVQSNQKGREVVDYIRAHSPSRLPVISESDVAIGIDNPVTLAFLQLFQLAAHPGDRFARQHLAMTPLGSLLAKEDPTLEGLGDLVRTRLHRDGFEATLHHWVARSEAAALLPDEFSRRRLRELAQAARLFDEAGDRSIDRFLHYARAYTLREASSTSAVQVMTIHKSKGLTFDMAILPQLDGNALIQAREGIAVHRDPATREVDWILEPPRKAISETDPVLGAHLEEQEAESGYESLCKFYVALTRARYANYLIASPLPAKSRSRNFVRLLEETLVNAEPEEETLADLRYLVRYQSDTPHTRRDWWKHLPTKEKKEEPAPPAPAPRALSPRLRPARRTPSRKADWQPAGALFATRDTTARQLGEDVHALFQALSWPDQNSLPPGPASPASPAARQQVAQVLRDPACLRALQKPPLASGETVTLWREQDFEILLDGRWISGTIDRVTIIRAPSGQALSADILDFKTDQVADHAEARQRSRHYAEQMALYRAATARLLHLPLEKVTTRLLFTRLPLLLEEKEQ